MGMTFRLDRLDGCQFELMLLQKSFTRIGYVSGIPNAFTAETNPTILIQALQAAGCPQLNDPFPAGSYSMFCTRITIKPASDQSAVMTFLYESTPGPQPGIFVVTDSTSYSLKNYQYMPGTAIPLTVVWTSPPDAKGNTHNITHNPNLPILMPLRQINIRATLVGAVPAAVKAAEGCVNSLPYLTAGLTATAGTINVGNPVGGPPIVINVNSGFAGYWLFSGFSTETETLGRSYSYQCTLSTRVVEHWGDLIGLHDPGTNVFRVTDPKIAQQLRAQPYAYGVTRANGVNMNCPYPMVDFNTVIGQIPGVN